MAFQFSYRSLYKLPFPSNIIFIIFHIVVKATVASARKTMYYKYLYVYETMERQSSTVQFRWIYILVFFFFLGETVKGTVVLAVIFHFYNNIILSCCSVGSIIVRWQAPDVGDIACFFFLDI